MMNSTDGLNQNVLDRPSFDPDYTAPWFFKQFSPLRSHETTSFLMAMAALSDGYDMRFFRSQREAHFSCAVMGLTTKEASFFEVSDGRKRSIFSGCQSEKLNIPSVKLVTDKLRSKEILHRKRLNTPAGGAVSVDNLDLLHRFAAAGITRLVVKPVTGSLGKDTRLNLTPAKVAEHVRLNPKQRFLVEQHVVGREFRIFVVGSKAVAANRRFPQNVVGDGLRSTRQLLKLRSDCRKTNPFFFQRDVDFAQAEMALLLNGDSYDRIPALGERVWLMTSTKADLSDEITGGLEHASPAAIDLCIKAAQALGLAACAFDLIVDQRGEPFILEANIRSMIGNMSFPHPAGRWNLDVPRALLQHFLPTNRIRPRRVTGFDYAAMKAEIFREGRAEGGVNAADFATFD